MALAKNLGWRKLWLKQQRHEQSSSIESKLLETEANTHLTHSSNEITNYEPAVR
jgi:hypothetical protein